MIETLAAQVRLKQGDAAAAAALLRGAQPRFPQERAIAYGLVEALLEARMPQEAIKFTEDDLLSYPSDAKMHFLQAKTYAMLGKRLQQHRAQAEAYALLGQLPAAVEQLELAQKSGDGNFYEYSQVDSRLREVKETHGRRGQANQAEIGAAHEALQTLRPAGRPRRCPGVFHAAGAPRHRALLPCHRRRNGSIRGRRAKRLPVMLKGPTGCGKTRFVEHMAWRLRRPLVTVACHDDLTTADLVGRYLIVGDETVWMDGPLTAAVRAGAICYLDEIVEARKDTTVVIHPLTDSRRALPVEKRGEYLEAPPDFMLVISYNPGYQSVLKEMKPSTRQRFVASISTTRRPMSRRIVAHEGGVDAATARPLVKLGGLTRKLKGAGLDEGAGTRLLVHAAQLIAAAWRRRPPAPPPSRARWPTNPIRATRWTT
jgi:nitric oxide reductase NorQ protein